MIRVHKLVLLTIWSISNSINTKYSHCELYVQRATEKMKGSTETTTSHGHPPLHTVKVLRRTPLNRVFAAVYLAAILALFYHHALTLVSSTSISSFLICISFLIADIVLAFMWSTTQSFRMRPVRRREFPENLKLVLDNPGEFPRLDVFICTADPYKEPPLGVVNTALSVMAYEYPTEKISVYVSDDGGSQLTLFAFMEAAKFAAHWLPFCRKKKIEERCPEAYFRSNYACCSETENIKVQLLQLSNSARVLVLLTFRVLDPFLENFQVGFYHLIFFNLVAKHEFSDSL